jgi:hypothetical protein
MTDNPSDRPGGFLDDPEFFERLRAELQMERQARRDARERAREKLAEMRRRGLL